MRVALASLDQAWQDKEANFGRCAALAEEAAKQGCSLVVFPEMTLTGYCLDAAGAEPLDGSPTLARFGELAGRQEIDLIFGASLVEPGASRPANRFCVAWRSGRVESPYAKLHPFTYVGEEKVFHAGSALAVTTAGGMRIGCGICYDLRFPEPFSVMASTCDALVVIANWPARRVEHWRTLLQARAIENQCYVLGVNRTGRDGNGLDYVKSSLLVAPDGSLPEPMSSQAELDVFEVEPAEVHRYREAFPTVRDKRFDLYRSFLESKL